MKNLFENGFSNLLNQKFHKQNIKRKFGLRFLFVFVLIASFNSIVYPQTYECGTHDYIAGAQNGMPPVGEDCFNFISSLKTTQCDNHLKYAPKVPLHTPIKKVQLIYHVFRKDDGSRNFQNNSQDIELLNATVDENNKFWSNIVPFNWTPQCSTTAIIDSRIRFSLNGILFHDDSDAWCAGDAYNQNPHGCDLFDLYVTNNPNLTDKEKTDAIHVFIVGCRKSGNNEIFFLGGYASGIPSSSDKFVVMKGWYNIVVENNNGQNAEQLMRGDISSNLGHEFGHVLGLYHAFGDDQCCDTKPDYNNTNNFMDYTYGRNITECQIARMHYLLSGKCDINNKCSDIHKTDITDYCNKDVSNTIVISAGQTVIWDYDKKVNTDIIIESLGELIVRCKLGMPNQGNIYVHRGARLFVDGGTITHNKTMGAGCTSGQWGSIQVYGNPGLGQSTAMQSESYPLNAAEHGYVIIKNGATIEYGRHAVSTVTGSSGSSWGGGGLVYANDATFINNHRSGEFLLYRFPSFSAFIKCKFNNTDGTANYGVTDWAVNGILFNECEFNNINKIGILPYDASITVTKSIFDGNNQGINAIGTMPITGELKVGIEGNAESKNTFKNNYSGIYSTGVDKLRVFQNTFKENKFGLAIIDLNSSIVKNNTFDHNTYGGTILENNNTISNRVICNNYVSEFIGMDIKGNNQGAYINNQTFQSVYDVTLKPKGVAGQLNEFGQQGDAFLNYFSNTGNNLQHINTIGNTIQFDYFYPNLVQFPRCLPKCTFNNPNPCIAPNNLVTYETQGFPINCNSNGGGFDDFCHTISCLENIGISLNNLINIATQRPLTHQENSELNILKVKYDNGILIITRNFIENSDYSSATTFLQGINSTFSKRILFSVYLIQNDTTAALQVLAAYPSSTVDDQYFKTCQLIKLSLIQQNFILSIDQKNELLQIAESNQFCAGYAKGILTYCEGILFNPEIPDLLDPRSIESKKGSAILDQMEIIPNPSSGNIIINIPNQDYKSGILKIFSSTGLEIWDTKIYSKISTYTTSIEISGVYFISLTDETGFSQVKKLIIK
jgi:hypothetical protein